MIPQWLQDLIAERMPDVEIVDASDQVYSNDDEVRTIKIRAKDPSAPQLVHTIIVSKTRGIIGQQG